MKTEQQAAITISPRKTPYLLFTGGNRRTQESRPTAQEEQSSAYYQEAHTGQIWELQDKPTPNYSTNKPGNAGANTKSYLLLESS